MQRNAEPHEGLGDAAKLIGTLHLLAHVVGPKPLGQLIVVGRGGGAFPVINGDASAGGTGGRCPGCGQNLLTGVGLELAQFLRTLAAAVGGDANDAVEDERYGQSQKVHSLSSAVGQVSELR